MSSVLIAEHPLIGNCLRTLRNRETQVEDFRRAMKKLGLLLAFESARELETTMDKVITPLDMEAGCLYVQDSRVLLIPILRAGLGFTDSFLELLPAAKVAHIGVSRDHETLEARPYLDSVPIKTQDFDRIFILDPMLATGNSSVKALEMIVNKGYDPKRITVVCALAVKEGIGQIQSKFPEVKIVTGVVDPKLNEQAYIVPGLGDAGDRLYLY